MIHEERWMITLSLANVPAESRKYLSGNALNVLDEILFIMRKAAHGQGKKLAYAVCGEEYLARKTGLSRVHVSRCIGRLKRLGLLWVTRRRQVKGVWQTNLYRLGKVLYGIFMGLLRQEKKRLKPAPIHHVTRLSHIAEDPDPEDLTQPPEQAWLRVYWDRHCAPNP